MNRILRAALDHGDTSLIATSILAHPRSHQLLEAAVAWVSRIASRQVDPTVAESQQIRDLARSFLIFDGELA
jgi:hypothetical protein